MANEMDLSKMALDEIMAYFYDVKWKGIPFDEIKMTQEEADILDGATVEHYRQKYLRMLQPGEIRTTCGQIIRGKSKGR